jgi:hypothetical protein
MSNPLRILRTLDQKLTLPVELTLFGRAALALGHPRSSRDAAIACAPPSTSAHKINSHRRLKAMRQSKRRVTTTKAGNLGESLTPFLFNLVWLIPSCLFSFLFNKSTRPPPCSNEILKRLSTI